MFAGFMLLPVFANWKVFEKMGKQGWKSLIPLYNTYILFELLYGKGSRMFLMLVPFYGIYVSIKVHFDLAKAFHKDGVFGFGLWVLNPIFMCILAFDQSIYLDGTQAIQTTEDTANTIDLLIKLNDLYDKGILPEEKYNQKKAELLKKI